MREEMPPKKPVVLDQAAFETVFVQAEQVMKKNQIKLIKSRLDKETNFDARMAYKICIKLIETGTLDDVATLDNLDSGEDINGDKSNTQSEGGGI